ncbi:hypothetical protein Q9L42_015185 [Methylomarinum sp. Ch1-1]|uniref:Uncharacterized protein n=1 Tax=Methylomarinum roseum TaxID=3067653 RepID=A0AAU7NRU7_9GAMM|nr:hypothetical protein [Methylomarinum sp. Ch1-1]MDP4520335.1 hypothetical protein [Methylomarinum sp. Ch1-1]
MPTLNRIDPIKLTSEQHRHNLNQIVNSHLDEAKNRVTPVYEKYFASPKGVLSRHWRNRSDIPKELAALPRSAWSLLKSAKTKNNKQTIDHNNFLSLSGKQLELHNAIQEDLLDIQGLDQKLQNYVLQNQAHFEARLNDLLEDLPGRQREKFEQQLRLHIERMSLPVEGSREALMFLLTGLIGKGVGASSFGSSIATGQAAATAMYSGHLSWWSSIWMNLTGGIPAWVSIAGAASGFVAALMIAPLFSPWLEIGINRYRGKKMLFDVIEHVRTRVIKPPSDTVDVLGKLALYLQLLPDIINIAKKIKR